MLVPTPILRHLRAADPVLGRVIDRIGRLDITPQPGGFGMLARSIVHQALSGSAAGTIHKRLLAAADCRTLTAEKLLLLSDKKLLACGLSRPKVRYLRGAARAVHSGEFSFRRLARLPDEDVTREMTALPGIGAWTAEMYLMFVLNRPDVFPILDAGIRAAMCELYSIPRDSFKLDSPAIAERWRPYRSIASRYLWASLDTIAE